MSYSLNLARRSLQPQPPYAVLYSLAVCPAFFGSYKIFSEHDDTYGKGRKSSGRTVSVCRKTFITREIKRKNNSNPFAGGIKRTSNKYVSLRQDPELNEGP